MIIIDWILRITGAVTILFWIFLFIYWELYGKKIQKVIDNDIF